MTDENQFPPQEDESANTPSDIAPSTIFVEMMRQAAARRVRPDAPPEPATPQGYTPPPAPLPPQPAPPQESVLPFMPLTASPQPLRLEADAPPLSVPVAPLHATPPPVAPLPAPELTDQQRESQRIHRVKRRQARQRQRRSGFIGGLLRTVFVLLMTAGLASTLLTWFTAPDFLNRRVVSGLVVAEATFSVAGQPTQLPTPNYLRKVGIVSGHRGPENDPGAVCPDGLTEASINFDVATRVVVALRSLGYSVDLLDEFDARLNNYQAASLVSIHANTCQDFGERVSGFLVAKAAVRPDAGPDTILAECIAQYYGRATQLERRFSLTLDMTDYHTFREIHPLTPAAILELGFMKDDRELLTTQQDLMAQAIVDGVLCFLNPPTSNPNAIFTTPEALEQPTVSP